MAIIARIQIDAAGQEDHDRLQGAVETRLASSGGPPPGFMAHVGFPSGGGLTVVEAFRTEESFRAYMAAVLLPALADVHLTASEPDVAPAWSIAIP